MVGINLRGTFLCSRACLPYLKKAKNPHILTLSPPLNLNPQWFKPHVAYTIAKYGMSMCVLGMAEEFREAGVAVNALWPRTTIATAALQIIPGAKPELGRTPEIMADAAHRVLTRDSRSLTGRFLIDEEVLHEAGIRDFERYAVKPGEKLRIDLFLDERG
jgi:citronellol/citronellal dehydrogenase